MHSCACEPRLASGSSSGVPQKFVTAPSSFRFLFLQAVKLLLMYGGEPQHWNRYRQVPESLATDDECIKLFAQERHGGSLWRQEMKERLLDSREAARATAANPEAARSTSCAICIPNADING
jgi:hypothetical protein